MDGVAKQGLEAREDAVVVETAEEPPQANDEKQAGPRGNLMPNLAQFYATQCVPMPSSTVHDPAFGTNNPCPVEE